MSFFTFQWTTRQKRACSCKTKVCLRLPFQTKIERHSFLDYFIDTRCISIIPNVWDIPQLRDIWQNSQKYISRYFFCWYINYCFKNYWIIKNKYSIRKNVFILQEGGSTHVSPTQPVIRVVLLHKKQIVQRFLSYTVSIYKRAQFRFPILYVLIKKWTLIIYES